MFETYLPAIWIISDHKNATISKSIEVANSS